MKTAVKVSPWVAQVILAGGKQVTLEPEKLVGKPNTGYTFTARIDDQPVGSRREWDAYLQQQGQNPKQIDTSMTKGNVALISFPESGEYMVSVALWDGDTSDAKVISSASSRVTIEAEPTDTPEIEVSIEVNKEPPYEGGCSYLFTARPSVENEQLPENIRWEWYWGDGGEDVRKGQPHANRLEHMISHTYEIHGNFTILVKLFNDNTNTLLATADMPINIDNLAAIQRTKWARAVVYCGRSEEISRKRDGEWVITGTNSQMFGWIGYSSHGQGNLKWNGDEFSIEWGDVYETQTTTYKITGKVSPDITSLETITVSADFIDTKTNWTRKEVLTLSDVPILKYNCGEDVRYTCYLSGVDFIKPLVTHYEYESRTPDQIIKFTKFAWDFDVDTPKLEVELSAMD